MNLMSKLWMDEAGFIVSSELVLIATILVIGMIAGLTTVRDQVVLELSDVADAFSEINSSYSYSSVTSHSGSTAGSLFIDVEDFCERPGDINNDQLGIDGTQCTVITVAADPE